MQARISAIILAGLARVHNVSCTMDRRLSCCFIISQAPEEGITLIAITARGRVVFMVL